MYTTRLKKGVHNLFDRKRKFDKPILPTKNSIRGRCILTREPNLGEIIFLICQNVTMMQKLILGKIVEFLEKIIFIKT